MKKAIRAEALLFVLLLIVSLPQAGASFQKQWGSLPAANSILPKPKVPAWSLAFWDLKVTSIHINRHAFLFPNDFSKAKIIHVKVGDTVKCSCKYKANTIALGMISEADANYWGSGDLSYKLGVGLFYPGPPSNQDYKFVIRKLPKFTFEDVKAWISQMGTRANKAWTESLDYSWTATAEHVGKSVYLYFSVDTFYAIAETNEKNNGTELSSGCVAKFIVTLPITSIEKDLVGK